MPATKVKPKPKAKPRVRAASKSNQSKHDHDAAAFAAWLRDRQACTVAQIWAVGMTVQEAWAKCDNAGWLVWLARKLGMTICYPGGAPRIRREMALPKKFPWEK